jgi:hypothetical protein
MLVLFNSTVGDIVENCREEHMVEMPQLITLFLFSNKCLYL